MLPILDKEVRNFLEPPSGQYWVAMYDVLVQDSRRGMIAAVCGGATVPPYVSLLRRIDVALWMAAKRENTR